MKKTFKILNEMDSMELATLMLRVGLGLVFLFGGLSKSLQLFDPINQGAMVTEYLGPSGYVNEFFLSLFSQRASHPGCS